MKIPIVGFDPSLRDWGIAESYLDLDQGYLDIPKLSLIEPEGIEGKQVRVNSTDLFKAEQLATPVLAAALKAKVVFVEVPVGSQTARAMTSYGICVGILGVIRAQGIPLIEVTASEVKKSLTNDKNATKKQMIDEAIRLYPGANWKNFYPGQRGITSKAEHVADAIGAIHAGVKTPMFQNLMRLLEKAN